MSSARHWCFTLNNYDEEELSRLSNLYDEQTEVDNGGPEIRYIVFQQEIGEEGQTPHLQGFLSLKGQKRLGWLKKLVSNRAHFIVARGRPDQNRAYCTKDSTRKVGTSPQEYGDIPQPKGTRCDIAALRDAIRNDPRISRESLAEQFPATVAKYPRFVRECRDIYTSVPEVENHTLRPWQQTLEDKLALPPGDREIIFIVDTAGNQGKTWYAKYYCQSHANAQYLEPGKKADMAHSLENDKRVLFVNVTRQQVDHLQYSFLESVKDGMVFSPKYESGMKFLPKMHVVVMMNQEPDYGLLSHDRYDVNIL